MGGSSIECPQFKREEVSSNYKRQVNIRRIPQCWRLSSICPPIPRLLHPDWDTYVEAN